MGRVIRTRLSMGSGSPRDTLTLVPPEVGRVRSGQVHPVSSVNGLSPRGTDFVSSGRA